MPVLRRLLPIALWIFVTTPIRAQGAVAPEQEIPNPRPFEFSGSLPRPTRTAKPVYPDAAWRANDEGTVIVALLVGTTGAVDSALVETHSPIFEESAIAAARKYRFDPVLVDGKSTRVWVRVPIRFRLGDPATDPRVLSDSLWRDPWSATPAVMRQQRQSFLLPMKNADEVWLFRLEPNSEQDPTPATARSRFARRTILDEASVDDPATRSRIRALLTDVRSNEPPPRLRGEFTPRLGVRFVVRNEVVDIVVSFADAALFVKSGGHLWAGSAMPHWSEWGRIAHAAFPDDPNFARYATMDPKSP